MKSFATVVISVVLALGAVSRASADGAQALNELLNVLDTIEANFTQTQLAEDGEVLEVTQNKIYLQRPGLLRLHTLSPYEQVIVTNRQTLWEYDPDFKEVIIKPYNEQLEQSPAALLSGDIETIRKHFMVEQIDNSRFKLTPISSDQGIESLELEFQDGLPAKITNYDSLGQTITFEFSDIVVNEPIPEDTFVFKTPPGVDEVIADG